MRLFYSAVGDHFSVAEAVPWFIDKDRGIVDETSHNSLPCREIFSK